MLGWAKTMGQRELLTGQTLLGPSLSTYLVQTISSMVIAPSSLPRIGPLSTFFRKLGEGQRLFLSLLHFQLNNKLATETHFGVANFASLKHYNENVTNI